MIKFVQKKLLMVALGFFVIGGLTHYGVYLAQSGGVNPTKISQVQEKTELDRVIYLQGKVTQKAPFLGTNAYQLQDDTGLIWILTKAPLPQLGEEISVKGIVRFQSIKIPQLSGKDVGEVYLEETEKSPQK